MDNYLNTFREMISLRGLTDHKNGRVASRLLGLDFTNPEGNMPLTFKGMLDEKVGPNLRNLIARGILEKRKKTVEAASIFYAQASN